LVNLESVLSFGKGIGIFLIFVGSLGLGWAVWLMCLFLAQLAENLAGLIILFLGWGEVERYDAFWLQTSFCFLENLVCLIRFLLWDRVASYLMWNLAELAVFVLGYFLQINFLMMGIFLKFVFFKFVWLSQCFDYHLLFILVKY
jgi:hypothetical protein